MSWDVVLFKDRFEMRPDAPPPPPIGSHAEVREAISSTHPQVDWSDPRWGVLRSNGWSIEFSLSDKDPLPDVSLHVRGTGNPLPAIVKLCSDHSWHALDLSTGDFLDPHRPSSAGWTEFTGFRDQVVRGASARPLRLACFLVVLLAAAGTVTVFLLLR